MKTKKKTIEYGRYGYYFILPFFIVFLIFQLYPLLYTIWQAFYEYYYKARGGTYVGPNFVGFANIVSVLKNEKWFDTETVATIWNTILLWILNFIPQILLSLLLAAWFTDSHAKLKGQGAYKVIMYMPNIITAASIAVLFYSLFGSDGPITQLARALHLVRSDYQFFESSTATILIIAFIQFWMWYGNTMIVLIAGILGISPSLYEAAMVDGATSKQQFFYITLPLLKPILQFTLVTSAIGGLQMYDIPQLLNGGKPISPTTGYLSTETVTMLIKNYAISNKNYGKAAAASVVLFVITLLISMVFYILTSERKSKKKHVKAKQ